MVDVRHVEPISVLAISGPMRELARRWLRTTGDESRMQCIWVSTLYTNLFVIKERQVCLARGFAVERDTPCYWLRLGLTFADLSLPSIGLLPTNELSSNELTSPSLRLVRPSIESLLRILCLLTFDLRPMND